MARLLQFIFIFLSLLLFVNSEVPTSDPLNSLNSRDAEIAAVLYYLNSSNFKVYNYKEGTLLNAQIKADIIELLLDVNVECINNYPEIPCTAKTLTCHAFVRNSNEGSHVLNDVNCKPKPEIIIEELNLDDQNPPIFQPKSVALSNEAISSEINEPFVAIRRDMAPCLGCPFDLNPNAEGVEELIDLALEHITSERPHKQALIKVVKLQQQVVAGVKFILIAEIGTTTCPKNSNLETCPLDENVDAVICEIVYLQKPWISKAKHIISNNCTNSQEFVKNDDKKTEINNEIDGKIRISTPNFDQIAESGAMEEISSGRLADLESQIILEIEPVDIKSTQEPKPETVESLSTEEDERTRRSNESPESDEITTAQIQTSRVDTSSSEEHAQLTTPAARRRRAIPQLEKISQDEKPLVKNLADFAAAAADNIDDDNYKRVVLQILGAKKMSGDNGVYYHLIMRMGISKCLEDKALYENCRDKLFENYTKICKVQVYVNDDFVAGPKVVKSQCQNIKKDKNDNNRTNYSRFKRKVGDEREIDKNSEIIQTLFVDGINHLNAQRNTNKHKPLEVISASKQVVSGFLYRIRAKIIETECEKNSVKNLSECNASKAANPKKCGIKVWEKKWENFREYTISCEDDANNYTIVTAVNRKKRAATGGQTAIDKNSSEVQQYLNEGINYLNSQRNGNKHKPTEVISATTQVVAGSLVRIKTKIAESDCVNDSPKNLEDCKILDSAIPKECLIKVWEKSWQNFKQYKKKCEGDEQEYKIEIVNGRIKRDIPGGETQIDKNSPQVQQYLIEGINHLNSQRSVNKHKPVEVLSATRQVVAGSLIRIQTKIAESDCKSDSTKALKDCKILENATPTECLIKIWEKPWLNFKEFTITCDDDEKKYKIQTTINGIRRKRSVGVVFDTSDNYVNEYLLAALQQLEKQYNQKLKVLKVIQATKQIVGGHIYRIKAQIITTNCKSNIDVSLDQCDILKDAQPQICKFKIFEAPWIPNSRQITTSCEDNYKSKHKLTFDLFKDFMKKYNKKYSKKEFKYRLKAFSDNLEKIEELNKNEQGTATYGITKFTDLTREEFSKFLGYRSELRNINEEPFPQAEIPDVQLPVEFDWRKKGAVTEVKNQEQCGSCWAFSVTGNVEGQYAIKHNKLLEFSEQELVDCDTEDQGCNGGLMDTAYRQIIKLGGLETEQDYPYDAENEKCHFNKKLARVQLSGAVNISHDETEMAKFLVAKGPISIAINANAMQFYFGGVSHPFKFLCSPNNLDHGVLIVGYGVHTYPLFNRTLPYWIVKNSWGTSWGEQGYYRVYRGDGTCGLNQTPSSAVVD